MEKKRFSSIRKMKGLKSSYSDRMTIQSKRQQVKEAEDQRKADKIQALEEKRKRQEENQRRRQENAKKSEITQIVKNPAKIKRQKKKLLKIRDKKKNVSK